MLTFVFEYLSCRLMTVYKTFPDVTDTRRFSDAVGGERWSNLPLNNFLNLSSPPEFLTFALNSYRFHPISRQAFASPTRLC